MAIVSSAACEHVVTDELPPKAPPKPGYCGTAISMATLTIRDGRNRGLELAARSFGSLGVDIGFVQETKCCRAKFAARKGHAYSILSTNTLLVRCRGVALLFGVLTSCFLALGLTLASRFWTDIEKRNG